MKSGAELVGRANPTALFVGAVAAVSTIAIGIGLVIFATSGGSSGGSDSSRAAGNAVVDHHDLERLVDDHHDGGDRGFGVGHHDDDRRELQGWDIQRRQRGSHPRLLRSHGSASIKGFRSRRASAPP